MLVVTWLTWWYGRGWRETARGWLARLHHLYLDFSIPILIRTLAAPWRRITSSADGPMNQKLRAALDNTVSRFVGLMVRLLTLIAAIIALAVSAVVGGLIVVLWPILPIGGLILILVGVFR